MNQQDLEGLRAVSLLRASSKQQTQKRQTADGGVDYDIPLQRNILTPWIAQQGMTHIEEFVEGGVSGYRVSTENRDKLQQIKQMAMRKEFDVLVIYMSDRLGRIADETPLVVSFLNSHGIRVISYTEGEIKADTHADKLMTYIRYWQAEGESLKTSMRVCDALADQVRAGKWRGGNLAYGYKFVSRGTLNNKGKPIFDVEIDERQADVVREIFRMARVENMGSLRIARHLNDSGIPAQMGGTWGINSIIQVLKNPIYKGIYVLHSTKQDKPQVESPPMESFRMIPSHEWDETQEIMKKRSTRERGKRNTTHGKLLLSGLVFCGTCGSKLTTLACKSKYTKASGELVHYKFYKYACSSLFTPKTDKCNGKNSYLIRVLEPAVIEDVKAFLATISASELVESYMSKLDADARQYTVDLAAKQAKISKVEFELGKLKGEIIRVLTGESTFSEKMIKELLLQKEAELLDLRTAEDYLQNEILHIDSLKCTQVAITSELDNWSELFDKHDIMRRKAMLYNIIDHIDVWRGRVEITYKIRLDTFAGVDSRTVEKCETSEPAPKKLDFDGKICYNTFGTNVAAPQTMQISQRREVLFTTPSGRQTSKERAHG